MNDVDGMGQQGKMRVVRSGKQPPCVSNPSYICRGCSSWPVMVKAAQPGGPWHGLVINCAITGLAVKWER